MFADLPCNFLHSDHHSRMVWFANYTISSPSTSLINCITHNQSRSRHHGRSTERSSSGAPSPARGGRASPPWSAPRSASTPRSCSAACPTSPPANTQPPSGTRPRPSPRETAAASPNPASGATPRTSRGGRSSSRGTSATSSTVIVFHPELETKFNEDFTITEKGEGPYYI